MFQQKISRKFLVKIILAVLVLVSVGTVLGVAGYLVISKPQINPPVVITPPPAVGFYSCAQDSDCIKVKADCCGCTAGGRATAINKNFEAQWKNNCNEIGYGCPDVMSKAPSCFKEPICVENKCVLEEPAKEISISTDKTGYEQGEIVKITLKNGLDKNIWYVDGHTSCTDINKGYRIYQFLAEEWIDVTPPTACPTIEGAGLLIFKELGSNDLIVFSWDLKILDEVKGSVEAPSGKYKFLMFYKESEKTEKLKEIYSNEFTIKEKSAVDPRCGQKVEFDRQCAPGSLFTGYEFDFGTGKCVEKQEVACPPTSKTLFNSLEECQKVCESNLIEKDSRLIVDTSSVDKNNNKVSDDLEVKIKNDSYGRYKETTHADLIIAFDHAPNNEDIQTIKDLGGDVYDVWSALLYAVHASLPASKIELYLSMNSHVVLVEENSKVTLHYIK